MGVAKTLKESLIKVVAVVLGFLLIISGALAGVAENQIIGTVMLLIGLVLIVFAGRL